MPTLHTHSGVAGPGQKADAIQGFARLLLVFRLATKERERSIRVVTLVYVHAEYQAPVDVVTF